MASMLESIPQQNKSALMHAMLQAVERAAQSTRRQSASFSESVKTKPNEALAGRKDYVTGIDTGNQRLIFDHLRQAYPDIHCFGEEEGFDHAKADPKEGDRQWVLDPIDSTRNLVAGTNDYSIALGCQEFRDDKWQTIAGVVAVPKSAKIIWAEKGQGAHEIKIEETDKGWQPTEKPIRIVQHHRTGKEAFDERAVEVLLVKQGEAMEAPVWNALAATDRRIIRMIDSGAKALAEMGTERHAIITAGLTELDKTAGLLIAEEAGAVSREYQIAPQPGQTAESGHTVHVVAADEEMLAELDKIVAPQVAQLNAPKTDYRIDADATLLTASPTTRVNVASTFQTVIVPVGNGKAA